MPPATINNPILPGFHPDPSILRVGDDYYIATSTFEWFPGVQIHHSRDLVNWRLLTRPLDRVSQLNMIGVRPSAGIWAPCLTHADGLFWLTYTVVRTILKDQPNYIVTAPSITGPWSEPIPLNGIGFDPSLFHDDDGKKYLVQMGVDPHRRHEFFKGIYLIEFDPSSHKLVGPRRQIFHKCLGETEGPHLYKRNDTYYLMVAEGGTGYDHAVTVARSKNLWGYEAAPQTPLISSRKRPELTLQKAGHGSLVETQAGEWYVAHLCARPFLRDNHDERQLIPDDGIVIPDTGTLRLAARLDNWNLQFFWAPGTDELQPIGPVVDSSILSDEHASWGFTGAFIGLCSQDLGGTRQPADFDYFKAS